MHGHLSVHFRQEEEELLLEVWWQGMEGPRVYQGTEVGVNKNGPRRLKIYLFPSVALHLPCGFWKQEEVRIFSLKGGWRGVGGSRERTPSVLQGALIQAEKMCLLLTCGWLPEASQERGRVPSNLSLASNSTVAQGQRATAATRWTATLAICMAAREP